MHGGSSIWLWQFGADSFVFGASERERFWVGPKGARSWDPRKPSLIVLLVAVFRGTQGNCSPPCKLKAFPEGHVTLQCMASESTSNRWTKNVVAAPTPSMNFPRVPHSFCGTVFWAQVRNRRLFPLTALAFCHFCHAQHYMPCFRHRRRAPMSKISPQARSELSDPELCPETQSQTSQPPKAVQP